VSAELVRRRQAVVTFGGGPRRFEADMVGAPRYSVAYDVPRNTMDARYRACTDHRVACDCREAELSEQLEEHRLEWKAVRDAARRALAGHQVEPPDGLKPWEERHYPVCLCSGCVIQRATGNLLNWSDVDHRTGRVNVPQSDWAPGEVPF
jgi:hypothetical protein